MNFFDYLTELVNGVLYHIMFTHEANYRPKGVDHFTLAVMMDVNNFLSRGDIFQLDGLPNYVIWVSHTYNKSLD